MESIYNIDTLSEDLKRNYTFLENQISSFDPSIIEVRPENSWSIKDNLYHLMIVEYGSLKLSNGTEEQGDKNLNYEKIQLIKKRLSSPTRVKAPASVDAKDTPHSIEELLRRLGENREAFVQIAKEKGENMILTDFYHPFLGPLTRLQWGYSNVYHTERHIRQMNAIADRLLA